MPKGLTQETSAFLSCSPGSLRGTRIVVIPEESQFMEWPDTIIVGQAAISRVVEWAGPLQTAGTTFPDTSRQDWLAHEDVLTPHFWDATTDAYFLNIQTWVLRTGGRTILVDTGVGNDRDRPQVPAFTNLRTDFLDQLGSVGVEREDVDVVVNTHIHYDHVGWNTHLVDGLFEPTFPHATYLVPRADFEYFQPGSGKLRAPETEDEERRFRGIELVFRDSVAPLAAAGQLHLWDGSYNIPGTLATLRPAPGHTPGSSVLWLEDRAVFVGDVIHTPLQVFHPHIRCGFDVDASSARASRSKVLAEAAACGAVILPAHLPGRSALTVRTDGEAFTIAAWSAFSES
jgi:glyoxylase-like metal-dependent hydrolase (beta-lactamase superfamily II)